MPKEGREPDTLHDLVALAALPRRVDLQLLDANDAVVAKQIRVAPMTFDVCAECATAARSIVEKLGPTITMDMLPEIISEHAPAVRQIIAAATGQTPEFVGALPLDQFGVLATAVFEVNRDFFVRRVGPTFKALASEMFGGDGPTPSTSSPSTGT